MRMLLKNVTYILLCLTSSVSANTDTVGIKFVENISWNEIKAKARQENKYIFVDCYATWCGPCKKMDKIVYTNDSVGKFFNANFISVKIQMDTSIHDNVEIIRRYKIAKEIKKSYDVNSFPTFIFFSPEGAAVHKGIGYMPPPQFISLSRDAIDPQKQYFKLIQDYENGQLQYRMMPYVAITATHLKDTQQAQEIAEDYIKNHLFKLPQEELYTKDNFLFILSFTQSSNDIGFSELFKNAEKIDRLLATPNYVESVIQYIISNEEIDPTILKSLNVAVDSIKWQDLETNIRNKYNSHYATWSILDAKVRWFWHKKNWIELTRNTAILMRCFGRLMSNWTLNGHAWNIVQYSNDTIELHEAVHWMKQVVTTERDSSNLLPASLDTYANLLYRLGERTNALSVEEKAYNLALKFNRKSKIREFGIILEKMKKNENIWPITNVQLP